MHLSLILLCHLARTPPCQAPRPPWAPPTPTRSPSSSPPRCLPSPPVWSLWWLPGRTSPRRKRRPSPPVRFMTTKITSSFKSDNLLCDRAMVGGENIPGSIFFWSQVMHGVSLERSVRVRGVPPSPPQSWPQHTKEWRNKNEANLRAQVSFSLCRQAGVWNLIVISAV